MLSQETVLAFKNKYIPEIQKEDDNKILMRCIFPTHTDNKRSAALYLSSGVYVCPVCGNYHISKLLHSYTIEINSPRTKPVNELQTLFFDLQKYPLHYMQAGNTLITVNVKDNKIIGISKRNQLGQYKLEGIPGFRLHAPIITESTTDAIFLIENGIDAGSIQSVANWHKITDKIYFPQIDKAGINAANKIAKNNNIVFWWDSSTGKDIRDIPAEESSKILTKLKSLFTKQLNDH